MITGWKEEMEAEYLKVLGDRPGASPGELADRLGISECCAVYWLTELAREGRLRILGVELVPPGSLPCEPQSAARCQRQATCPAAVEH
jgi:hypothetical protein